MEKGSKGKSPGFFQLHSPVQKKKMKHEEKKKNFIITHDKKKNIIKRGEEKEDISLQIPVKAAAKLSSERENDSRLVP